MAAFFDMGGYAGFIWPAYILTIVLLAAMGIGSWRALRSAERELAERDTGRDAAP